MSTAGTASDRPAGRSGQRKSAASGADPSRLTSANSPKMAARPGCREGRISCMEIGVNQSVLLFAGGLRVGAGLHTSATAAAIDSPGEVMAKKASFYQPCRQRCTVLWQAEPVGTEAEPVLRIPASVTTGPERLPGTQHAPRLPKNVPENGSSWKPSETIRRCSPRCHPHTPDPAIPRVEHPHEPRRATTGSRPRVAKRLVLEHLVVPHGGPFATA